MNLYAWIVLLTLLIGYGLDLLASLLNLRALRDEVPEEFRDVYDAEAYARSQAYTRVRTRFGLLTATVGLGVTLLFWFAGGFGWLDDWVRAQTEGTILRGLLFIGSLLFARALIGLPFSLYSTFVIEERFGFNRTTWRTWVLDRVKGLLLGVAIGGPLLALVLAFFEYAGDLAWLYCWVAASLFSVGAQFVFPRWILPLFNEFTPLEEGRLRDEIESYTESVDFPVEELYVMDGSRRSSKSNAFFTGFGRNKRIALFDTLVGRHTVREVVAVLAHEVGHYKKKHIVIGLAVAIAHSGVVFFLLSIFLEHRGLFEAFYVDRVSIWAGLVFFGMLYSPIELLLSVVMNWISRRHEYQADRYAAATTGDPGALISALEKLSRDNLSNLTPHPLLVLLEYSHPPVLERVRALARLGKSPGQSEEGAVAGAHG